MTNKKIVETTTVAPSDLPEDIKITITQTSGDQKMIVEKVVSKDDYKLKLAEEKAAYQKSINALTAKIADIDLQILEIDAI